MMMQQNNVLLALDNVSLAFGGLQALEQVSFGVARGAVKAVIGPNGAGKTTLFNLVTGFLAPQAGRIVFEGEDIQGRPAHKIARQGVARTFQLVQLFDHMYQRCLAHAPRHKFKFKNKLYSLDATTVIRQKAMEALEFVGLADRARQSAAVLPLGLKRMLEIARALASTPTLLLLDEPASGLDAVETDRLKDLILELRRQGITTLLVEHDMGLTMEVADDIAVLNYGKLIADGPPRAIQKNPEVIAAYLGTDWQT
jgi:ABC-type branched-subunit amino acid transport system ATPase component